jgi:hypothetical protein
VTDLRDLANGYRVSQAIHVAATLGIADLLADGPLAKAGLRLERTLPTDSSHYVLEGVPG